MIQRHILLLTAGVGLGGALVFVDLIQSAGAVPVRTQQPDVLESHNAFQALGSRATNKRIPSFWVSKGAPRLGWCWQGNPHSWLGAASAAQRLAP